KADRVGASFFFQAEDGIRDRNVTGVQTCALPISFQTNPTYMLSSAAWVRLRAAERLWYRVGASASATTYVDYMVSTPDDQGEQRSEERRVGKECRARRSSRHEQTRQTRPALSTSA